MFVCTSGSAVAHYLPAILEAQYSGYLSSYCLPIDLIPCYIQGLQTVDQQKSFGTAVKYYEEVPQKEHYYTYPRQVAQSVYESYGYQKGPVHINVPLFEPLVPELDSKHFEAGRSPTKYLNLITVIKFSYQNRKSIACTV